ncbi:MAG TPA: major capsid family protein [Phormidium sp.]
MPDNSYSLYVSEQLRVVRREVIEYPLPEFPLANGLIVPRATGNNAIPRGATSYLYYLRTFVGEAKIIANPADDLPTVDLYTFPMTGVVHDVGDSYRYSDKDLENAQFAGQNLTSSKALAAKEAAFVKLEKIGYLGDSAYNLQGFMNHPNVPIATVLNDGANNSTQWRNKTAIQVLRDLRDMSAAVPIESGMRETADTLLIPSIQDFYLGQTFTNPLNPQTTLKEAFFKTQGADGIQNIQQVPWLSGAFNGQDVAIVYKRREDKVKLHVPIPFYAKNPQESGFSWRVPCRLTTGGVELTFPLSARIFVGI